MATLVLSAVGQIVGGPIGSTIGAIIGREIDGRLFGPRHEGPRLKELKISGSSYGEPIARHYGRVRAGGSIIWATDLKERSEKSGGSKGKPKVRTYSYSISFAVALASAPIERVGRIWADGNLLRGAAGDLKTQGTMRVYEGHGDQRPDPLLVAALGNKCPAFRGTAYVVFEDLQLADFGNRIPTLSFEIFAGRGSRIVAALAEEAGMAATEGASFPELQGYSHEGGDLAQIVAQIDRLHPLAPLPGPDCLVFTSAVSGLAAPVALPDAASWSEGDFGREDGASRLRQGETGGLAASLRYYDPARDYQPGLQRPVGRPEAGDATTFEFPGVLSAGDAKTLIDRARARQAVRRDTLSWRVAELDPRILPGTLVTAPGMSGVWQVASWEWRQGGIELSLRRHAALAPGAPVADPGNGWVPPDRPARPTILRAFEVPFDGRGDPNARQAYVAATAASGLWPGAALYWQQGTALTPIGEAPGRRAIIGMLTDPLAPGHAHRFAADAMMRVTLVDGEAELLPASIEALANGANRALVGREILQFAAAEPLGDGAWALTGLLRGRGGTEAEAQVEHRAGSDFILLDDRLVPLDQAALALGSDNMVAAIGLVDPEPVLAPLDNAGATLKPLCPVHPRLTINADGSRTARWTRRARGSWGWLDEVEQPIVEDAESYELGIGPVHAPFLRWSTVQPVLHFASEQWASLVLEHAGRGLWVRQSGRHAKSDALLLAVLS